MILPEKNGRDKLILICQPSRRQAWLENGYLLASLYILPEIKNMNTFFVNVFCQDHNYGIAEYILVDFGGNFTTMNPPYDSQAKKIPRFYLKFINSLR